MMPPSPGGMPMIPKQVANFSLNMFTHKHSVIIDMIMIQLISAILCGLFILVFKGGDISQTQASIFMIGMFSAAMTLGTVYSRINRM
tara:strand:+ start:2208 stop:2468 length:261 start_codon:yes stop_codon:yes gene_type:complete